MQLDSRQQLKRGLLGFMKRRGSAVLEDAAVIATMSFDDRGPAMLRAKDRDDVAIGAEVWISMAGSAPGPIPPGDSPRIRPSEPCVVGFGGGWIAKEMACANASRVQSPPGKVMP